MNTLWDQAIWRCYSHSATQSFLSLLLLPSSHMSTLSFSVTVAFAFFSPVHPVLFCHCCFCLLTFPPCPFLSLLLLSSHLSTLSFSVTVAFVFSLLLSTLCPSSHMSTLSFSVTVAFAFSPVHPVLFCHCCFRLLTCPPCPFLSLLLLSSHLSTLSFSVTVAFVFSPVHPVLFCHCCVDLLTCPPCPFLSLLLLSSHLSTLSFSVTVAFAFSPFHLVLSSIWSFIRLSRSTFPVPECVGRLNSLCQFISQSVEIKLPMSVYQSVSWDQTPYVSLSVSQLRSNSLCQFISQSRSNSLCQFISQSVEIKLPMSVYHSINWDQTPYVSLSVSQLRSNSSVS